MPRYPFTPALLDALPEELAELFRGLELQLLEEICSRLKIADQLNEVTVQDIRALRAHGIDLEDIKAAVAEAAGTGMDKLEALLDDVVERNQAYYPDFAKTCGYGSVTGIGGANCRHSYWPYIEGVSERTYTDAGLEAMKPENRPKIKFEGREYDDYQATQKQREIERTVRKLKRRKAAFGAAGLTEDAQAANIRLRRLNEEYRNFSRAAGLKEQRERMQVLYQNGPSVRNAAKNLEKRPHSGIIKAVEPEEVPDVGKNKKSVPKDVTAEYLRAATPGSHLVRDLRAYTAGGTTYTVDGHRVVLDHSPHEKEVAELLERTLGGEIFMVPRVNAPQGVPTPDYLIRGKGYDLKTIGRDAGPKTIWNRIKKAKRQAHNFIVDVTDAKHLTDETINGQLEKIFQDDETLFVDEIILIRDGMIAKIVKRA